jgi:hypothetical protein
MKLRGTICVFFVLAGLLLIPSASAVAQGCLDCISYGVFTPNDVCLPVRDGDTGTTVCYPVPVPGGGQTCITGGNFCSTITVIGGGGGRPCVDSEGCPAECFSCPPADRLRPITEGTPPAISPVQPKVNTAPAAAAKPSGTPPAKPSGR